MAIVLSIFIIYSPDRKEQFFNTINCLNDLDGIERCQKILCVDGKPNFYPDGFEVIEIARKNKYFNWSHAWKAALSKSKHEVMWYLESDRILPVDYLKFVESKIDHGRIIYSDSIFALPPKTGIRGLKSIRDNRLFGNLKIDSRLPHPPNLYEVCPGKGAFSGNVVFTKTTYHQISGVDSIFEGPCYWDTDIYISAYKAGLKFIRYGTELHQYHPYNMEALEMDLIALWNAILLKNKWNMILGRPLIKKINKYNISKKMIETAKSAEDFVRLAGAKFHL